MDTIAELRTLTDMAKRQEGLTPQEKELFEKEMLHNLRQGAGRRLSPVNILHHAKKAALRGKDVLTVIPVPQEQLTVVGEHCAISRPDVVTRRLMTICNKTGLEIVVVRKKGSSNENWRYFLGVSWRAS